MIPNLLKYINLPTDKPFSAELKTILFGNAFFPAAPLNFKSAYPSLILTLSFSAQGYNKEYKYYLKIMRHLFLSMRYHYF